MAQRPQRVMAVLAASTHGVRTSAQVLAAAPAWRQYTGPSTLGLALIGLILGNPSTKKVR